MASAKYNVARYISGISLYFGAAAIPLALNLVINPFIAMNMSARDYAITGYFTSFNTLLTPLIQFYLIGYYLKLYYRLDRVERTKLYALIFKNLIYLSATVTILVTAMLYVYMTRINPIETFPVSPYLFLAIATIPFAGIYNLRLADLRIRRENRSYFHLTISHGIAGVVATFLLVVIFPSGALGKLTAPLVVELIFFTAIFFASRKLLSVKTDDIPTRPILLFCAPLVAGAMMQYFAEGYTATFLESLGNVTEYGHYIVGASIGSYILVFSCAISSVFQSDFYQAIAEGNRMALTKTLATELGMILLVVICFIAVAPSCINILTAGRYTAATGYARITSVGAITSAVFYRINSFSIATNHKTFYFLTTVAGSAIIVSAMPIITRSFGYTGGACLKATSYLIFAVINIILLTISYRREHRPL